jgi:hypothetical protein
MWSVLHEVHGDMREVELLESNAESNKSITTCYLWRDDAFGPSSNATGTGENWHVIRPPGVSNVTICVA